MGYFTWALIVMFVNVLLITFFMISYFKEIMEFMKENNYGFSHYNNDNRGFWLVINGFLFTGASFIIWPVMVVAWLAGLLFLYLKSGEKFDKIMEIIKGKTNE